MSIPPAIRAAFDPEALRTDGHRLVDVLADQLARWHAREGRAVPWRDPREARAYWAARPPADLVADLVDVARSSTALAHPHVMAHQVPPPLPAGVLAETVAALLNQGMAVYEMGLASAPIELNVIAWMCEKLGLPAGAGGLMTSGGSLGNLTALLAMRQARAGYDAWSAGAHGGPPLAVVVSSDAHYSIARTLGIMGLGAAGAIVAPVDDRHRLTGAAVERALATAGDRRVIGIVAAAGSTATGTFDPLDELADVAERYGLWLHVDAAHGGGVALSKAHRSKLRGIERADSVVWDAHKLLMMPALVTAVLFKREPDAYAAFAQEASYLFADAHPSETWWDLGSRTLECTKRMMAVELWACLRHYGEDLFGEIVDRQHALATEFAAKLAATADFEVAYAPESNIVCYRHRAPGTSGPALDAHNRALRKRLVEIGEFYVVGTQLRTGYHLRSTIMNPLVESTDLDALIDHLRALAA